MHTFVQDVRHSLRMLRQNSGFTVTAVAALALGIGANTAIFSVLNTVLLKPLPYPDPNRLVVFLNTSPQGSGPGASPTKFNVWRRQTAAFQDVSAYRFNVVNLTDAGVVRDALLRVLSRSRFRGVGSTSSFRCAASAANSCAETSAPGRRRDFLIGSEQRR